MTGAAEHITRHVSDARSITANQTYSVPQLAAAWDVGRRAVYHAIRQGRLRAARINGRGDLRVLGAWALAFLESQSTREDHAENGNGRG